jgi:predicted PurR-regulated permease PerM
MQEENSPASQDQFNNDERSSWFVLTLGATFGALILFLLALNKRIRSSITRSQESTAILELNENSNQHDESPANLSLASIEPVTSTGRFSPERQADIKSSEQGANAGKRWSTPTRYIMGVLLFFAVLVILYIGRSAIPLVAAAALLAVVLDPMIRFLARRLKYNLAVGIIYFLVVVILLALPILAIPALVEAVNFFARIDYNRALQEFSERIENLITTLQANPAWSGFLSTVQENLVTFLDQYTQQAQMPSPRLNLSLGDLTSGFGKALGTVTGVLGPTFSAVASLFITILISLQMTLTTDEMKNWFADLIPPGVGPELTELMSKIRLSWTGFLRGQIFLMLVIGVATWLGGLMLGLPGAFLLGIIAGVMELIPSIGPVIAAIPAVLVALFFGSVHFEINHLIFAIIVIVYYALVQLFENQILVPRIMGNAVDLPPLIVLIGIIAGAGAFGILGALLATPVIATGNLVFRFIYARIIESAPPPPEEEKPGMLESLRNFMSRLRLSASRDKHKSQ